MAATEDTSLLNSTATTPNSLEASETLSLGSKLALKIGSESLEIADNRTTTKRNRGCAGALCGSLSPGLSSKIIPLYNILSAATTPQSLTIVYAHANSATNLQPRTLTYPISSPQHQAGVDAWVARLVTQAYGPAKQNKRAKVLLNPHGGTGSALSVWEKQCKPIWDAAQCAIDVEYTTHHKHAIEIAQGLDIDKYDVVLCVSGDGVPHEVFNGLAQRPDARRALRKLAVCQLPGGSGNGLCWSLTGSGSGSVASLAYIKGVRTKLDLVSITQGETRTLSFLSQAFGIVAECDLGTDHLRWMGDSRFTFGILTRIFGQTAYPCTVAVKAVEGDKVRVREMALRDQAVVAIAEDDVDAEEGLGLPELRWGTVNDALPEGWEVTESPNMGNFYVGNMPYMSADTYFFPAASNADGLIDMIRVNCDIPRMAAISMMTSIDNGTHVDSEVVRYEKVEAYRLTPHPQKGKPGFVDIDGEPYEFAPWQVEVHQGLGTVLTPRGSFVHKMK